MTRVLIFFLISFEALAAIVGYGSSDAVYPAKNQEFFYMGFNLGLKKSEYNFKTSDVDTEQITDKKALSALRGSNLLIARNKDLVVLAGYPTSHESLLVSKVATKEKTVFISSAGSHSSLSKQGSFVFSLGESLVSSQKSLLAYLLAKYPSKPGLVITNPRATFSVDQKLLVQKMTREDPKFKNLKLEYASLSTNQGLAQDVEEKIVSGKYSFLVLTTYADDSTALFDQLVKNKVALNIYTNPSWIVGDIEFVRRLMVNYPGSIYSISSLIKGVPAADKFEEVATKEYGSKPSTEMYYGYDTAIIIGQVLKRIEGPVTKDSFHKAFLKDLCFTGTTAGRLCFPAEGGHAFRDVHLLKFLKRDGFVSQRVIGH